MGVPTKKNTIALVGFILSLVGLLFYGLPAIPGLICSIVGVAQSKKCIGKPWRGLAISGIVIGIIVILIYGIIIAVAISEMSRYSSYSW
jgi:sorbitol-specific phosphotransferase system component IIC